MTLESCNNWLVDNKLCLHLSKTEHFLALKQRVNKVENFIYTMGQNHARSRYSEISGC